jgi:hypothetical protein
MKDGSLNLKYSPLLLGLSPFRLTFSIQKSNQKQSSNHSHHSYAPSNKYTDKSIFILVSIMSYQAKIDFVLHLHEFNNVDLFQQGIYYLRLMIYHKDQKGRIIYATPSYSLPCEEHPDLAKKLEKDKKVCSISLEIT